MRIVKLSAHQLKPDDVVRLDNGMFGTVYEADADKHNDNGAWRINIEGQVETVHPTKKYYVDMDATYANLYRRSNGYEMIK